MRVGPVVVTALWGLCVCLGLVAMVRYEITPGLAATPPSYVAASGKSDKSKLFLFLHPQCACSSATVGELARVLRRSNGTIETTVFFYQPSSEGPSYCVGTPLWNLAKELPRATLRIDRDGHSAKAFGARCSGQILLYAAKSGRLVFSGGITESRGHEGESRGADAILDYIRSGTCAVKQTNVFGCAIW